MVAAAIGSTVTGLFGAGASASAASDAADAQEQAAANSLQLAQTQYNTLQGQISPYLAAGQTGLTDYANLSGANGSAAQASSIGGIKSGAQYQGDMQTANENILANASATGGLRGSNTSNTLANTSISNLNNLITSQLGSYGTLLNSGLTAINGSQAASNSYTSAATAANNQTANAQTSYAGSLANSANSALGSITSGINRYSTGSSGSGTSALSGITGADGLSSYYTGGGNTYGFTV